MEKIYAPSSSPHTGLDDSQTDSQTDTNGDAEDPDDDTSHFSDAIKTLVEQDLF